MASAPSGDQYPSSLPNAHRAFLNALLPQLQQDPRLVGVTIGGSYLRDSLDEYSDLDLVIAVEPADYDAVLADRTRLAASLGKLLAAFTGEHVGEPRLLICLYAEPLLHVDLKFVSLEDLADRVEEPAVLWQRAGRISDALEGTAYYTTPDAAWLEARFWTWIHYGATKIGRGELFEALSLLDYLRGQVLSPLGLMRRGLRARGVRHVEQLAPELARALAPTIARHDARDCLRALSAAVDVYRSLRDSAHASDAETAVMSYLAELRLRLGAAP